MDRGGFRQTEAQIETHNVLYRGHFFLTNIEYLSITKLNI